jgi:hypothetical protein
MPYQSIKEFPPKDMKTYEQRHGSRQGVPGCSWPSCWSQAGSLHSGNTQIHQIRAPSQSNRTKKTHNIEEPGGTWRRKRGRTLGRLVLLRVALPGHLGLLAVATAHGGWIRRRSIRWQLRAPRPAAGPRRSSLGLWFTGGEGDGRSLRWIYGRRGVAQREF